MTTELVTEYQCIHCKQMFRRESSLAVHLCEPKRRSQERNETGVQIGLQAYLRFYEMTQGSSRLKTWDDFAQSSYYRAFVKFGRYAQSIRAVSVPRFIDWLIQKNKKLDHWCRDSVYSEFLLQHVQFENVADALARAIETAMAWEETTGNPSRDYLRYGNDNVICYAVTSGKITPWILYNCESGQAFLSRINQEQISLIWPWINSDIWQKKFQDYPADVEYAKMILSNAGW